MSAVNAALAELLPAIDALAVRAGQDGAAATARRARALDALDSPEITEVLDHSFAEGKQVRQVVDGARATLTADGEEAQRQGEQLDTFLQPWREQIEALRALRP